MGPLTALSNLRSRSIVWPSTLAGCVYLVWRVFAKAWKTRRWRNSAHLDLTRSQNTTSTPCNANWTPFWAPLQTHGRHRQNGVLKNVRWKHRQSNGSDRARFGSLSPLKCSKWLRHCVNKLIFSAFKLTKYLGKTFFLPAISRWPFYSSLLQTNPASTSTPASLPSVRIASLAS